MGVKGVGEAVTIAAAPAVINAVVDALARYGVRDVDMPASPQRIWQAISSASTGSSAATGPSTRTSKEALA
jgi:aerobic carbon-monoxide dehydrogenase large subunit